MIALDEISSALSLDDDGVWRSARQAELSYPIDGNATCFGVEDSSFWFQHRNRVILSALGAHPPGGRVFDVGGGNGFVTRALLNAGYAATLVEPGPDGIRNALQRGIAAPVQATLESAGFDDHVLPACGLFDVLEHVANAQGMLDEARRVLRPRGVLYVTVPALPQLWSDDDIVAGHHRRYTRASLRSELERAGFSVAYLSYFFAPLLAPVFLRRSLPYRLGRRRERTTRDAVSELAPRPGLSLRTIKALLAVELRALRKGARVPMGSSCLAVATSRAAPAG